MTGAIFQGGPMRAIARNLGWMLASRGVLAVLSLVYLAIVTRTLGVAGFGRFALITGASQALRPSSGSRRGRSSSAMAISI